MWGLLIGIVPGLVGKMGGIALSMGIKVAPKLISKTVTKFIKKKVDAMPPGTARIRSIGLIFNKVGNRMSDGVFDESEIADSIMDVFRLLKG